MLIDTHEVTTRTGATRGQLLNWRRKGLVRPMFRVGDLVLTEAEVEATYPSGLAWPLWSEDDVTLITLIRKLTDGGLRADAAGRYAAELLARSGAAVLVAPGVVLRVSVCTCIEDCDPFRAEVAEVQRDLRPAVVLPVDPRPAITACVTP